MSANEKTQLDVMAELCINYHKHDYGVKHTDVAIHPDIFKTVTSAVADLGFPRIGGANSPGGGCGAPTYDFAKISQKTT